MKTTLWLSGFALLSLLACDDEEAPGSPGGNNPPAPQESAVAAACLAAGGGITEPCAKEYWMGVATRIEGTIPGYILAHAVLGQPMTGGSPIVGVLAASPEFKYQYKPAAFGAAPSAEPVTLSAAQDAATNFNTPGLTPRFGDQALTILFAQSKLSVWYERKACEESPAAGAKRTATYDLSHQMFGKFYVLNLEVLLPAEVQAELTYVGGDAKQQLFGYLRDFDIDIRYDLAGEPMYASCSTAG